MGLVNQESENAQINYSILKGEQRDHSKAK